MRDTQKRPDILRCRADSKSIAIERCLFRLIVFKHYAVFNYAVFKLGRFQTEAAAVCFFAAKTLLLLLGVEPACAGFKQCNVQID